jgi:hypothetical protein
MACGNNEVSRSGLASQPTPSTHPRIRPTATAPTYPKATGKQWYSKHHPRSGVEVMFDKHGRPTIDYPHVHVIHDERKGEIRVVLSLGPTSHPELVTLPGDASGNEVNRAVETLCRKI